MVVKLALRDGTIREYPVAQRRGASYDRTGCGNQDCDHLECAIIHGKRMVSLQKLIQLASPFSSLLVLGIFVFTFNPLTDPSTRQISIPIILLIILLDVMVVFIFGKYAELNRKNVRELEEFRDQHTVNGIPAKQVTNQ